MHAPQSCISHRKWLFRVSEVPVLLAVIIRPGLETAKQVGKPQESLRVRTDELIVKVLSELLPITMTFQAGGSF